MAFIHASYINLNLARHAFRQESYTEADINPQTGQRLDFGLHDLESSGAATKNEGFFEKGLLRAMESDHIAGGSSREVKVVANGHCHGEFLGRTDGRTDGQTN